MKRYAVGAIVLIALLAALTSYPDRSSGQDASEDRIAALETQVADLSSDVSSLRKRVKKLEQASPSEVAGGGKTPGTFKGTGSSSTNQVFGAGDYTVSAECSTTVINVYVTNEEDGTVQIPVSISTVSDDSNYAITVPKDATLLVEVTCDGDWSVSFE